MDNASVLYHFPADTTAFTVCATNYCVIVVTMQQSNYRLATYEVILEVAHLL